MGRKGDLCVAMAILRRRSFAAGLGKYSYRVTERQTDILVWKDGGWKSVLTHETKIQSN